MKRFLALIILVLLPVFIYSQTTIYYNESPTILCNPQTTDFQGNPFNPGDILTYEFYGLQEIDGDIETTFVSDLVFLGESTEPILKVTNIFTSRWNCSVRFKITRADGLVEMGKMGYSTQDIPVTASGPLAYDPNQPIVEPQGLRDSGI